MLWLWVAMSLAVLIAALACTLAVQVSNRQKQQQQQLQRRLSALESDVAALGDSALGLGQAVIGLEKKLLHQASATPSATDSEPASLPENDELDSDALAAKLGIPVAEARLLVTLRRHRSATENDKQY